MALIIFFNWSEEEAHLRTLDHLVQINLKYLWTSPTPTDISPKEWLSTRGSDDVEKTDKDNAAKGRMERLPPPLSVAERSDGACPMGFKEELIFFGAYGDEGL